MEEIKELLINLTKEINALKEQVKEIKEIQNALLDDTVGLISNLNVIDKSATTAISLKNKRQKEFKIDKFIEDLRSVLCEEDNKLYLEHLTKENLINISNSNTNLNNVKICFVHCYSHIESIRKKVLSNILESDKVLSSLYTHDESKPKCNSINDLLKWEANKLYKHYKEDVDFKKLTHDLKEKCNNLINSI